MSRSMRTLGGLSSTGSLRLLKTLLLSLWFFGLMEVNLLPPPFSIILSVFVLTSSNWLVVRMDFDCSLLIFYLTSNDFLPTYVKGGMMLLVFCLYLLEKGFAWLPRKERKRKVLLIKSLPVRCRILSIPFSLVFLLMFCLYSCNYKYGIMDGLAWCFKSFCVIE